MTDTIVWVHGDCLNPNNPALKAYPNAQAIFVFCLLYTSRCV